jgi:hypothetical protein
VLHVLTQVDESFEASEGAQLTPHLTVTKHVGSGTSADVYKLQSSEQQLQLVLKMAKPVPELRRAFQREWMLGRRLNAVAAHAPELDMIIHTGMQQQRSASSSSSVYIHYMSLSLLECCSAL